MARVHGKELEALRKRHKSFMETSSRYDQGRVELTDYGATLGWYNHFPKTKARKVHLVINVGPVVVGMNTCYGGVSPGSTFIFLGREGRLWKVPKREFSAPASNPKGLDKFHMRAWADVMSRAIVESMTPPQELQAIDAGCRRYREVVSALVDQRVVESAKYGMDRRPLAYAHGVSEEWDVLDLKCPRAPSLRHALMTSLVLGLDAKVAAELIELGALLEYKAPVITRPIATAIHQKACSLLMAWCPAWAHQSFLLDWRQHGSIDRYLRQHYLNLLRDTIERDISFDVAAGI